jgi:hypothetical protein
MVLLLAGAVGTIVTLRVAVLGAGIQGTCAAFALAAAGHRVDLYDRNAACVTETSAQNEGKIHLGYVYANDPSRRTARMMARGALCFAPLMRRWLGSAFDRVPVSSPFRYAVNAASLLTVDAIRGHFDDCVRIAGECASPAGEYFGRDFRQPVRRLDRSEWEATFSAQNVRPSSRPARSRSIRRPWRPSSATGSPPSRKSVSAYGPSSRPPGRARTT